MAAKGDFKGTHRLQSVPLTLGGAIQFQVENVMAAVAAAWALNLDWDTIRLGLASFSNDTHNAQGRFNLFQSSAVPL